MFVLHERIRRQIELNENETGQSVGVAPTVLHDSATAAICKAKYFDFKPLLLVSAGVMSILIVLYTRQSCPFR